MPWQHIRISRFGGPEVNKHALPKGASRLLEVELIARELPGWVQAGIQTLRVIDLLRLPPWHPRTNYFWPSGMK
jgi:hypothetical protein